MSARRRAVAVLAGACALLALGCDDVRRYGARGIVEDVRREDAVVVVDHGAVRGLMGPMTMTFDVPDADLLARLEPGQRISFTLVFTGSAYQIVDATVLGTVEVGDEWARLGEQLVRTTVAPPFSLRDQDGRVLTLDDLAGRALLVDFVFTQCPGPCPLQTARAVAVQRALPDDVRDRVHFVSISLDPANDTPEAFRAYARKHGADTRNWSFLGGDPGEVDAVVRSYAVGKTRDAEGVIEHLVVSLLVNGDGKIVRRYLGREHGAEEIAADLVALARTPLASAERGSAHEHAHEHANDPAHDPGEAAAGDAP